ncbi:potassium transporter TrkG, partial [Paracoccus sp. (in: a-proteobacteria)]|uniref:potassium transporter TrkG n=1 Tax=Paracoccus sp. TaxID=267 RepID=UPI0035B410BF
AGVLETLDSAASAAWGGMFTGLSYLTTTGWNSIEWQGARNWSGLSSPGLMLAGLAMMGGGVATTAGGVKLLRVYALARHSERELEKIVHPSSIGGGGMLARRLRREGAYLAFIFFMLFATTLAVVVLMISVQQIEFDSATILSIAALTNTGPLAGAIPLTPVFQGSAGMAGAPWQGWAGLPAATKAILAGGMIVGRLETLVILALLSPEYWRR